MSDMMTIPPDQQLPMPMLGYSLPRPGTANNDINKLYLYATPDRYDRLIGGTRSSFTDRTIAMHCPQQFNAGLWVPATIVFSPTDWRAAVGSFSPPAPALPTDVIVGEIRAWRAWDAIDRGDGVRLHSVSAGTEWLPGQPMEGDVESSCYGVHAWNTPRRARNMGSLPSHVWGEVALWGQVVEHERGYRAQYCRIVSLNVSGFRRRRALAAAYGPSGVIVHRGSPIPLPWQICFGIAAIGFGLLALCIQLMRLL